MDAQVSHTVEVGSPKHCLTGPWVPCTKEKVLSTARRSLDLPSTVAAAKKWENRESKQSWE